MQFHYAARSHIDLRDGQQGVYVIIQLYLHPSTSTGFAERIPFASPVDTTGDGFSPTSITQISSNTCEGWLLKYDYVTDLPGETTERTYDVDFDTSATPPISSSLSAFVSNPRTVILPVPGKEQLEKNGGGLASPGANHVLLSFAQEMVMANPYNPALSFEETLGTSYAEERAAQLGPYQWGQPSGWMYFNVISDPDSAFQQTEVEWNKTMYRTVGCEVGYPSIPGDSYGVAIIEDTNWLLNGCPGSWNTFCANLNPAQPSETKLSIIYIGEAMNSAPVYTPPPDIVYTGVEDYSAILTKLQTVGYNGTHDYFMIVGAALTAFFLPECSGLGVNLISKTDETVQGANDGAITVAGNGGTSPYNYSWSNGATSASITGLPPGTYTVTILDSGGCTFSQTYYISYGVSPCTGTITIAAASAGGCGTYTLTPTVTGTNVSFYGDWISPTGVVLNGGQNYTGSISVNSVTAPGIYTFQIDLGERCIIQEPYSVTATNPLTISMTSTDATTSGGSDGTATATVGGGTAPYTYIWANGGTTSTLTGLTAGTYNISVQDANGCTISSTIVVGEPSISFNQPNPLDMCIDLDTDTFVFTDNQDYTVSGVSPLYSIAIDITLVSTGVSIYTGNLATPDIIINNDLASIRTYNFTTKYGKNNSISILSGGSVIDDIYLVTFHWDFTGDGIADTSAAFKFNGNALTQFNSLALNSSLTYDCNDDIITLVDTSIYSINNTPFTLTRNHSITAPTGFGIPIPAISGNSSILDYQGLELGQWTGSLESTIEWNIPGNQDYIGYCINRVIGANVLTTVTCNIDPCVVYECIMRFMDRLEAAECDRNISDIKKYRHIIKRVWHLLTMYRISVDCVSIVDDTTILFDLVNLTDCGCDCQCGGCDGEG